jgi:hypothetical protein
LQRSSPHLGRARQGARQAPRHGAAAWRKPKGAERIAACWADHHKVAQIVFKPDWAKHAKAAPFKRNDQMLEALPAGLVAFPGSGISANLADKARKLGIPVWRFATEGAAA